MELSKDMINTRTGMGAAIGALIGFAFGGPLGAGIGGVIGGGVAHASGDAPKGVMTPKRQLIFTKAMESMKEPEELLKLAAGYESEGLKPQAAMLRKRAALRKLPMDKQELRRIAFRKAMACDDPEIIMRLSRGFQSEGAIDAAKALRDHAEAVKAAHLAGKSSKPMTGDSVSKFADKLGKALITFGPQSPQAISAARNLILARGKTPSDGLTREVIRVASEALKIGSTETPAETEAVAETEVAVDEAITAPESATPDVVEEAATASADAAVVESKSADPETAPVEEGTVMGPPARPIEPPVVAHGAPTAAASNPMPIVGADPEEVTA